MFSLAHEKSQNEGHVQDQADDGQNQPGYYSLISIGIFSIANASQDHSFAGADKLYQWHGPETQEQQVKHNFHENRMPFSRGSPLSIGQH